MRTIIFIILILIFITSINFTVVNSQTPSAEDPIFSHNSGFYSGSIQITLSVLSPGAIIHYTLDSSDPMEASPIYAGPIEINQTTVVRARTFQPGFNPGNIKSHTYILNQDFSIPALSIITDPTNIWGDSGIYSNYDIRGDEWERPATIEFFESDGSLQFSSDLGLRIHGGTSRVFEKKSFRYYFRSEYGQSRLRYQLFKPKDITEFKRFVSSASFQDAPGNSAYGSGTLLRDAVMHEIGRRIEKDIALGTRPVALFLLGKPWGIYNAIERIDRHFVEINFGINDCDIIENLSEAREGTMDRWNEMIGFFESSDLSLPHNYEIARSYIDIQNFTRYYLVEIYGGNMDWPDYNNFAFSGRNHGDKWKWVLWDLDNAFAYISANNFALATDDTIRGTVILRKLLENDQYRVYFLNECADIFNTTMKPENVKTIIDSLAAVIRNDIGFEVERWGGTIEEWENSVQFLKNFASYRLDRLWQYILGGLDVEQKYLLTLQTPEGGKGTVRLNSLFIGQFPWEGYYPGEIPIELEAIPKPGFKFKRWSDPALPSEKTVTLIIKTDYLIYPVFEPDNQKATIVINEINYNSAANFDPEDWVELYNPSGATIDLSDWHLKDDDDTHDFEFPGGTMIEPHGFLVVSRNQAAFHNLFPVVNNCFGDFGFGLGGSGDAVRIYNSSYVLIDSVTYDDKAPWPIEADGNGATLELIDPALDNTLPETWRASKGHGSPAKPNLSIPQLTGFVVKDSSGSTKFTNSREVLIEMTDSDNDGKIIEWLINENSNPPDPGDFVLVNRPTNYYIQSPEGAVTIYGWVLDDENQVSFMTDSSHTKITLDLTNPNVSLNVVDSTQLQINYCEPVVGAADAGNYEIIPSLDSITVTNQSENRYQLITLKEQNPGLAYQLIISNVTDSAGNSLEKSHLFFTGYGSVTEPLKLKLIKGSQCEPGNGWENAVDGDIDGADGTVRANGKPCFAIFAFSDEGLYLIHKFRLITDSGIGSADFWARQFQIEVSTTDLNPQNFVSVLNAEQKGGDWEEFPIAPIDARYIKFNVIQPDSGWRQVAEFEAWGKDSTVISAVDESVLNTGSYYDSNYDFQDGTKIVFSNFPNPFNERTNIIYKLSSPSHLRITVYNIIGEEVNMLVDNWKTTGIHQVSWDGRDAGNMIVPSGIYLLRVSSDKFNQTRKVILMK